MTDMRQMCRLIGVALLLAVLAPAATAPAADRLTAPPFAITARAAVLLNDNSGEVLCGYNHDLRLPPASLTKLMTLYLAFEAVQCGAVTLDDTIPVSAHAAATDGSTMFLREGSRVRLGDVLQGIAVVSANDGCVAVAEYIAGAEEVFVARMNRKARALGLANTLFRNSHGLPNGEQHTTALDIARLAHRYIRDFPQALSMHAIKVMTYNGITQRNRNGLLWRDAGVDGLKTGWFTAAGFHIVATALRDGQRLTAVVLGGTSERHREETALRLLNYGFRNFRTIVALTAGETLARAHVWKGSREEIALTSASTVPVTVARDAAGTVSLDITRLPRLVAPLAEGTSVGTIRVAVDGVPVDSYALVTAAAVPAGGFVRRSWHTLALCYIAPPYWGVFATLILVVLAILTRLLTARKGGRS